MKTKIISLVVCLAILAGLFPGYALAEDDGSTEGSGEATTVVATIGETGYATLAEAVNGAAVGDTIVLQQDVEVTSKITITKQLTLDGNDHTVKAAGDFSTANESKHLLGVEGSAAAGTVIKNITLDSNSKAHGFQPYNVQGQVTLTNVKLLNSSGSGMTVNGSSVTATGLTVSGSGWGQSIDVSNGVNVSGSPALTLTHADLQDRIGIFQDVKSAEDAGNGATVTVDGVTRTPMLNSYTQDEVTKYKLVYSAPVATIGSTGYPTLAAAVAAAENDSTITVQANVEFDTTIQANTGHTFTLDLNGKTVTYADSENNTNYAMVLSNGTQITIVDKAGNGKMTSNDRTINVGGGTIKTKGTAATLILNGGTIESTEKANQCAVAIYANSSADHSEGHSVPCKVVVNQATVKGGVFLFGQGADLTVNPGAVIDTEGYYAISGNGSKNTTQDNGGTVITIKGGTITQTGEGGAIYHPQDGTLTITGNPTITGSSGIQLCSGEGVIANITGGTVIATGADQRNEKKGDGYIPDGAAISVVNRSYPGGTPKMTISGGTFVSEQSSAVMAYTWEKGETNKWESSLWEEAGQYLTISGGSFSQKPDEAWVAAGCQITGDGPFAVSKIPTPGTSGGSSATPAPTPAPTPVPTPTPAPTARPEATATPVVVQPDTETPVEKGPETLTVTTQVGSATENALATAQVESQAMQEAVAEAVKQAAIDGLAPAVKVEVAVDETAEAVAVTLPVDALADLAGNEGAALTISSDLAQVTLDATALAAVAGQAQGEVRLVVQPAAAEALSQAQVQAAGEFPVISLTLESQDGFITDFNSGVATVTLPHTLAEGQRAEGVVVWYLDAEGNTTPCPTRYDAAAGLVTFETPHFSEYIIGYDAAALPAAPAEPEIEQPELAQESEPAPAAASFPVVPVAVGLVLLVLVLAFVLRRAFLSK